MASTGTAPAQQISLPGKFDVSATGAALYSIPIAVPPGTAGMTPALTLDYNSQSGDGILGIGWSLGGLPSIGRCAQTMAQDGVIGGVNYDANDRFCLDSERLVAINGGTYGADGTEWRIKNDDQHLYQRHDQPVPRPADQCDADEHAALKAAGGGAEDLRHGRAGTQF